MRDTPAASWVIVKICVACFLSHVVMLMVTLASAASDRESTESLESTRALLESYLSAKIAAIPEPEQSYALDTLRERRPVQELVQLFEARDRVIWLLKGPLKSSQSTKFQNTYLEIF